MLIHGRVLTEAATGGWRCSVKKLALKILQYSHRKTPGSLFFCQGLSFNKIVGLRPATLFKKEAGKGVFL